MRIGLTGGIGCGKSTVARELAARGFSTLDADKIVHELLAEDADTIGEVVGAFGAGVCSSDGGIDRSALGELVFGDPDRLAELEGILHPRVRERWESASAQGGNWVIEIPLLFEKNLQKNVDLTVCVFSDPASQLERLETRGMNRTQALARMERQMPVSRKAELADMVLLNDGSLEFLREQIDCLTSKLETLHT